MAGPGHVHDYENIWSTVNTAVPSEAAPSQRRVLSGGARVTHWGDVAGAGVASSMPISIPISIPISMRWAAPICASIMSGTDNFRR